MRTLDPVSTAIVPSPGRDRAARLVAGLGVGLVLALVAASLVLLTGGRAQAAYVGERPSSGGWGVNGTVYATAVAGDTVVVGGSFSAAVSPSGATVSRNNLAAFSLSTGALLESWRADASAAVRALVTDGSSVWVGGAFTSIGGVSRSRLARLSVSSGSVDSGFRMNATSAVRALALDNGSLYAGGDFSRINNTVRTRLAKGSASSGTLDGNFVASADASVRALAIAPGGSTLYVGGTFSTLSGSSRYGLGGVSATSGAVSGPSFSSSNYAFDLDINDSGTRLYGALAGYSNSLSAWSTSSGSRQFRQTAMGDVQAVDLHGNTVFFGFHEGFGGDTSVRLLAADASTGALDSSFRPTFDRFWGVWSITATSSGLVAGGDFTWVSGVPARNWARWN